MLYYAPAFTEPEDVAHAGNVAPGKDTGGGVESAATEIPPGLNTLKYDSAISRFVLSQPGRGPTSENPHPNLPVRRPRIGGHRR